MNEDKMEPFIFAIVPKVQEATFKEQNPDLQEFTSTFTDTRFTNKVILTDTPEIYKGKVPLLIDDKVIKILAENEKYFDVMHLTDFSHFYPSKYVSE